MKTASYDQHARLRVLFALSFCAVALIVMFEPLWPRGSVPRAMLTLAGSALVLVAVFGRLWATLYIGGRKNAGLTIDGPYSITRNPLYFFSTLGAAGVGLLFGSLALGGLMAMAVGAVLHATSRGEAAMLRARFGTAYEDYAARVPLFWPRPRLYREAADPRFDVVSLRRTFRDALFFLLAIPLADVVARLKEAGELPQLIPLF